MVERRVPPKMLLLGNGFFSGKGKGGKGERKEVWSENEQFVAWSRPSWTPMTTPPVNNVKSTE